MDWLADLWYYRKPYVLAAAGAALALLLGVGIWWFSIERLPGYNVSPVLKNEFVEPGGAVSRYVTGTVISTEISILGPKLSVRSDATQQLVTFYLPENAPVWLGMITGDKAITGNEKLTFADIKVGQRIAVFIGPVNKARRVNILKR